jgi:transposase
MKNATACRDIDLTPEEFAALCARVDDRSLQDRDYEVLRIILDSYGQLAQAYREKGASIKRLLKMLFGAPTEKTNNVLKRAAGSDGGEAPAADGSQEDAEKPAGPKRVGHGCNGAAAYTGAERVHVAIEGLKAGDSCPECSKGTVYEYRQPGVAVRVVGQPPLKATVYELQKLRCGSCGALFTADMPKEAGSEKYDATAATAIGTLKYGYGFPFNRLQKLEANLGVPVPAAVQWEQVDKAAAHYVPVYRELVRQGAQGDVVYNDDTPMKVIALMQESATADCGTEDVPARTGVFTTGVVSTVGRHTVALFFTGRQHAGENLADVLQHRSEDLAPPIQMCDAASRNTPKDFKVILANCSAHARRGFVDVVESFPVECSFVIETFRHVYVNDAAAKHMGLSAEERLWFHQDASGPLMDNLHAWLQAQFPEKRVEENSSLGAAISYMLKRWEPLTLFLRQPGAPLDSNLVERALKMAIRHRRNSLFYLTPNGALVGDIHMTLIHTCNLNGVNPFDYLTALQRHYREVYANPSAWLPWNYKEALAAVGLPAGG